MDSAARKEILSRIPYSVVTKLLNATDAFAVQNVLAKNGGPFGASIHIYDLESGEIIPIGKVVGNAVIATGIGSNHAEAMAISPENVSALRVALQAMKQKKRKVVVLISSSGQSCPGCHSKEEILARTLEAEGLIERGHVIVSYGATFQQTAEITRFADEPYILDAYSKAMHPSEPSMVTFSTQDLRQLPREITTIFLRSRKGLSVVISGQGNLSIGYDQRVDDITATSEVQALRRACGLQQIKHLKNPEDPQWKKPWDLRGATLFTSTQFNGSLIYAEAQWSNTTKIVHVPHDHNTEWATQEAVNIPNCDLYNVINRDGYNAPSAAVTMVHVTEFPNLAQPVWNTKLKEWGDDFLYNGIDPPERLKGLRQIGQQLFTGWDARIHLKAA